ncbi:molybdate transport system substrate-binding protein [Dyadobacter jejuensis]|uniref:Molybdate transport system substrate-binding protein n=1 Tax=Dyadobacter jejuensis TaxID=1082580 RepID=A0A316APH4_9BACT|nr:molybdate ABC transporter substrate-binding protein [Dyadobacter jejuensis]PWJ59482.1 molybdate transport system substrate-binding protein [Dyadobacter jejuensis]
MKIKLLFLTVLSVMAACSKPSEELMIATAANVQYVMNDIKAEFEKESGKKVQIIVGSSGKLTAQIREGAPFDVFVSADTKYPEEIYKQGGSDRAPQVYARGALVLWSKNLPTEGLDWNRLKEDNIHKIAIPNPQTAPYGEAALQALEKTGLMPAIKTKLVYGESIAQTAQYITSGSVDVGFNALSIVLSSNMKDQGHFTPIDTALYAPIQQAAILLRHSENSLKKASSEAFYEFLYSERAQQIFRKYGYR